MVPDASIQPSSDISSLLSIMKLLRSPQGCPWDREQTSASLVSYTLEEAYEVADAVETGNRYKICEELGDLLLQIVFHCQIAEEQDKFNFGDVVLAITEKLVRRHPHIFADAQAESPGKVSELWAEVKAKEAGQDGEGQIPPLPSLLLLEKVSRKVDMGSVEDPLIRQLILLTEEANRAGRSLEAEIRRFCAKFWA